MVLIDSTHSCVHWLLTSRKVIEDLPVAASGQSLQSFDSWRCTIPHPPSPHIVIDILLSFSMTLLDESVRSAHEHLRWAPLQLLFLQKVIYGRSARRNDRWDENDTR